jgi:hypothetical protein
VNAICMRDLLCFFRMQYFRKLCARAENYSSVFFSQAKRRAAQQQNQAAAINIQVPHAANNGGNAVELASKDTDFVNIGGNAVELSSEASDAANNGGNAVHLDSEGADAANNGGNAAELDSEALGGGNTGERAEKRRLAADASDDEVSPSVEMRRRKNQNKSRRKKPMQFQCEGAQSVVSSIFLLPISCLQVIHFSCK